MASAQYLFKVIRPSKRLLNKCFKLLHIQAVMLSNLELKYLFNNCQSRLDVFWSHALLLLSLKIRSSLKQKKLKLSFIFTMLDSAVLSFEVLPPDGSWKRKIIVKMNQPLHKVPLCNIEREQRDDSSRCIINFLSLAFNYPHECELYEKRNQIY